MNKKRAKSISRGIALAIFLISSLAVAAFFLGTAFGLIDDPDAFVHVYAGWFGGLIMAGAFYLMGV
jgi:hypothetical protein